MYSTTILKSFLWQGRRYTYFKYTILAFFSISPSGCALRALRFGRVSTDFDIRGRKRAKGETGKRELFSPSVSCADSSLIRGRGKGGTPEVGGTRKFFFPSVSCADSFLVRGSGKGGTQTQRERKGRRRDLVKRRKGGSGCLGAARMRGTRGMRGFGSAGVGLGYTGFAACGGGRKKPKETHGRRQEAASPAARKCAAGLVGDILLTIRDGQEIRPCRPSRTAPSSP